MAYCRYCPLTYISPNMPANTTAMPSVPARSVGTPNSRGSSRVCSARSSWLSQPPSSSTDAPNPPSVDAPVQPEPGALTRPYSSARHPAVSSRLLTTAIGRRWRGGLGVTRAAQSMATSASGAAMRNSARQEPSWTAAPPPTLPSTAATPVIEAQTAISRGRWRAVADPTSSANVVGSTAAAPTPAITRPHTSTATLGAAAHTAVPPAKTAIPASSAPLRPTRSASAPAGTSRQANTTT
ncbi:MAG: hypothetical protein QOG57_2872 [Pseudonocardiales bacterium]|nr:hypothetical protein [Pseudonocardiales bacterium]